MSSVGLLRDDIDVLATQLGGWRAGKKRGGQWWIPHPSGGELLLSVTVRPRWCSVSIDRWHAATDRPDDAPAWCKAHLWPVIESAYSAGYKGSGFMPGGGASYSGAFPIEAERIVDFIALWVGQELLWVGRKAGEA